MTNVAWNMMENMGWKEGQGLGKESQGLRVALKPSKKMDNAGLGKTGRSAKWLESCCAYDSILAKLNQKYGGDAAMENSDDDAKPSSDSEKPERTETKEERRKRREEKRQRKAEKKRKRQEEQGEGEDEAAEENGGNSSNDEVDDETARKKAKKEKKRLKKEKAEKSENDTKSERKKEKKSKNTKVEESSESEEEKHIPVARHIIYAKRHKSKQVSGYSSENKAEIFAVDLRAAKAARMRTELPYGSPLINAHYNTEAKAVAETNTSEEQEEEAVKGQVGTFVDDGDEEEEYDEDEDGTKTKRRITYENGFTEDTQVEIFNEATEKQIKGRLGLGTAKKMSKSQRREHAQRESNLLQIGTYLAKKFVFAGTLDQMTVRKN